MPLMLVVIYLLQLARTHLDGRASTVRTFLVSNTIHALLLTGELLTVDVSPSTVSFLMPIYQTDQNLCGW